MRKSISAVEEAEDKWERLPKDKFSDKQRRYFFAVGAMRQGKEDDGYVEVNYSKLPKKSSVNESKFDSTQDAVAHISIIKQVVGKMVSELQLRGENHDLSKFQEPEKSQNDYYIPLLKEVAFGTQEYVELNNRRKQDIGLLHHFEVNRHHPEHFENGIKGMTLVDIVEMFCDWYSASQRSDTGFEDGLEFNRDKFKMSDELYQIFRNTYEEYFTGKEKL